LAIDPANIDEAVILTAERDGNRTVICKVPRNGRVSPCSESTAQEMRDAQAEVNRLRKIKRKAEATSARRMKTAAQLMEDDRRKRVAELRAAGTDDLPMSSGTLRVVSTGIDTSSIPPQTVIEHDSDGPEIDLSLALDPNFDTNDGDDDVIDSPSWTKPDEDEREDTEVSPIDWCIDDVEDDDDDDNFVPAPLC
jgi:hypothetical protein